MVKAWHYIYYSLYQLLCKASLIFKPIFLILKIPAIKKYYEKRGLDPEKSFDNFNNHREYGHNIGYSELIMHFLLIAILFSIFNLILIVFNIYIQFGFQIALPIFLLTFLLNWYILLRDDYHNSFEEFDTYKKARKRGYYLLSYLFIIIVFVVFYYSFIYGSEYHSISNK